MTDKQLSAPLATCSPVAGLTDGSSQGSAAVDGGPFSVRTHRLLMIACLAGTNARVELEWHIRKALKDGCLVNEVREVLSMSGVYCDSNAAVSTLNLAAERLDQWAVKA